MDSHHSSALLHIQTLERIPNVRTFTHIKCLHGVREEWPKLMCLVPDLFSRVSSLLCCKHRICKHHGLQERAVTRIQNTGPVAGDGQPYSTSSPEERQARHRGCGFWIKKVPPQRSQRGCALCPAEPGVPCHRNLHVSEFGSDRRYCIFVITSWLTFFLSVEGLSWAATACWMFSSPRWVMMVKPTHEHPGYISHWGDIYTNTLMYIFNWVIIYWP